MSLELHEMHALLQQFQDIHQSHDLDHCESRFGDAAKAAYEKAKATASAAAAKASATVNGAIASHKQHTEEVKTKKDHDTVVQEKWTTMSDADKKQVLKTAVEKTATSLVTDWFFSNPTTKKTLQQCIEEYKPTAA